MTTRLHVFGRGVYRDKPAEANFVAGRVATPIGYRTRGPGEPADSCTCTSELELPQYDALYPIARWFAVTAL